MIKLLRAAKVPFPESKIMPKRMWKQRERQPSTFRAAELRGGQPLQPETSFNSTVGLVVDTGPFTLTADYFRVDVSNRLALSQTFTLTTDERALLLSEGITSAGTLAFFRFFINDFSSRTQGIDLVSTSSCAKTRPF